MSEGRTHVHHNPFDVLNVPVIGLNVTVLAWNWDTFWSYMPGPTAVYAGLSAVFMLFQMADRLGLLPKKREPNQRSNRNENA